LNGSTDRYRILVRLEVAQLQTRARGEILSLAPADIAAL